MAKDETWTGNDDRPSLTDTNGSLWTWRGKGYAIASQPDTDWLGRPWTTSAQTIDKLFGIRGGIAVAARLVT